MKAGKECVLYDRVCIECGECNYCDIDPTKICDNCKKCIDNGADFSAIRIDGVLTDEEAMGEEYP